MNGRNGLDAVGAGSAVKNSSPSENGRNRTEGSTSERISNASTGISKDEKIHDNVIGMYINRYYFEDGRY